MQFFKDLNVFHLDGKEIPCITALGAPDDRCPGVPGVLYMDSCTGRLYLCTSADTLQQTYSWRIVSDVDTAAVQQAVSEYIAQHPVSGGGISPAAAALLITILQNAVFTSNQTGNIAALQEALASGGSSGGDSGDSGADSGGEETVTDDITVADGVMTIIAVGSAITVADGVMTIA